MSIWRILSRYESQILEGLWVTMQLVGWIWALGIIGGLLLGVAGHRWKLLVGVPSRIASFSLSGIPILVFLFWLHYPLQALLQIVVNPFYTAVTAIGLVNVFLVADTVRNALNDFPRQYESAGSVVGLSRREIVTKIQLPIILRQILPGVVFLQVAMLQATLFASLISVDEIFRVAQRINSEVYRPVEIYTGLALLFLVICLPLNGLGYWLKRRYTRDFSER